MKQENNPTLSIQNEIAIICLGHKDEKAIILNDQRMQALDALFDSIHKDLRSGSLKIKGLIITSPPNLAFCLGADINAIKEVTNPKEGARLAAQGQSVFNKIETLPIPSVAAIHGHCVGGGCELSLACDYRIMTDGPGSKIGLPETKLGILPGFGGTQRLPRVIGLPKALDIILNGKVIPSKKAYSISLVDKVIPIEVDTDLADNLQEKKIYQDLISASSSFISRGKRDKYSLPFTDTLLSKTFIGRMICRNTAKKTSYKKTKGQYPAIPLSIELCVNSFSFKGQEGYTKEATALGELIVSPVSKSLVHIFFLTESATKLGKQEIGEPITSLALIGAGVMGKGIASVSVKSKLKVFCFDLAEEARKSLYDHVRSFINTRRGLPEKQKDQLLGNLSLTATIKEIPETDLYIEAAVENLEIKRKIFSEIAESKSKETIIATNTSSLSLKDIFDGMPEPSRAIGIHFFNPVEKMPLVELVRLKETSDKTLIRSARFVSKLGKYPVVVEDVPGFLVNRILTPYLAEASQLLKEGASFTALENTATKFGFPMGPFRLIDEVGLDIAHKVEEILGAAYGERMKGAEFLTLVSKKGLLGKKSGKGFYVYEGKKTRLNSSLLSELGISENESTLSQSEIEDRLILSMLGEAFLAYHEGVAGIPGQEASNQIDLASIMGFGFPPFRGGIMYYAKKGGLEEIKTKMNHYQSKGPRFGLAKSIKE
jgi:3-hydroxyacyl-CoA dehydrogenase / enoyl-CoA hydratase / 3-hydroxybutyryl-CoA epimerase